MSNTNFSLCKALGQIFLLAIGLLFINTSFAQVDLPPQNAIERYLPKVPNPHWFKTVVHIDGSTPEWAVMMYGEDPNVHEVTTAYQQYFEDHKWTKDIHVRNYIYWKKEVKDYINEDGFIRLPSLKEQKTYLQNVQEKYRSTNRSNTTNWTAIGPFETYGEGTTTPRSNQVNVYELDQSNSHPDILYAATEGAGVYKSIDKGLNWSTVSLSSPFARQYGALEIHPTNPDTVIIVSVNLIYRTLNGGISWTQVGDLGAGQWADDLKFHPTQPDSVFIVGQSGLFLSTDGGASWLNTGFTTDRCRDIDFHPTNPNIMYLLKDNTTAVRTELFKSTDGGATWLLKDSGYYSPTEINNAIMLGGKIAVTPANPNRVYVALIGNGKTGDFGWIGVMRSNDSGETWTNPSGQYGGPYQPANTMPWNLAALGIAYHQGFYNFDFEVSPTNADLLWVGTLRLSESTDGGTSFISIGGPNDTRSNHIHSDIQDIEVGTNGELLVATDGGVDFSSDNGQTFSSRKKGINGSEYWGFGTGWNEDVLVGGRFHNGNGAYYQAYGFGQSVVMGGTEESTGYIHPLENKKALYAAGGIDTTTAIQTVPDVIGQAHTTLAILNIKPNESYGESESSGFYFDPRYANHFYVGKGSRIYKSTDAGNSFTSLHDFGSGGLVFEVAISRNNPDYIYLVFKPSGTQERLLYRTTNGGTSWSLLTNIPATNRNKLEITLNPLDENEIWVCSNLGSNGQKVYRSTDGGSSWSNRTTPTLDGEHPIDIMYQGGTNNVVYLATRLKMYYYNQSTNDWVDYSSGLPARPRITLSRGLAPFYRDNKLRLATGGWGIWEAPLVANSTPVAQPITLNDSINCIQDTVQFDSYSIVNQTGVSWQWTFSPAPQWISSTTVRNPRVVFGTESNYDVTLSITQGGNTHSKTVTNMIKMRNMCVADTIPGLTLDLPGNNSNYARIPNLDLNSNTATISAWINPDLVETAIGGIVFCRSGTTISGLRVQSNNRLHYQWNDQHYGWTGGPMVPANEWSHVALVIEPTQATVYLNGVPYVNNAANAIDEFNGPTNIGYDPWGSSDWAFDGKIDEVCIWDRSLTQNEIRALMHLTKEDIITTDANLRGYYQFNETNGTVFDKSGRGNHAVLVGSPQRNTSTAPVGGGTSNRQTVTTGGIVSFPGTDIAIEFPASGTYPNGELVVSKLNISPDQNASTLPVPSNTYWILNNYGTNPTFTAPTSVTFSGLDGIYGNAAAGYSLFKRSENADGNTWASPIDVADAATNTSLTFSLNNNLTSSGQLMMGLSGVQLNTKALLQGAYSGTQMNDNLRGASLIPLTEPYTSLSGFTHINGGGETVTNTVLAITGNDAIVDWVFLELRDKTTPANIQHTRSALIQRDGDIVDFDGTSPVIFSGASADDYYVAVRHRNHLGIRTSSPVSLSEAAISLDFTNSATLTFGSNARQDLGGGVLGMWGGNANENTSVRATGPASINDYSSLLNYLGTPTTIRTNVYVPQDLNMDGNVRTTGPPAINDYSKLLSILGIITNIISEQL